MAIFASKSQIASTVQHTLTLFWTLRFLFFWDENFSSREKSPTRKLTFPVNGLFSLGVPNCIHPQRTWFTWTLRYYSLTNFQSFVQISWQYIYLMATKRDSTREGCSRAQLSVTTVQSGFLTMNLSSIHAYHARERERFAWLLLYVCTTSTHWQTGLSNLNREH